MSSIYAEVRNNFYDEEENKVYIDAWKTPDDNEEGIVVAKVDVKTKEIEYLEEDARYDDYVKEVISEVIDDIETGLYSERESE